jgi:hypothetical protein
VALAAIFISISPSVECFSFEVLQLLQAASVIMIAANKLIEVRLFILT